MNQPLKQLIDSKIDNKFSSPISNGKNKYLILALLILIIFLSSLVVVYSHYVRKQALDVLDALFSSQVQLRINTLQVSFDNLDRNLRFLTTPPEIQGIVRATLNGGFDSKTQTSLEEWKKQLVPIFVGFANANPNVTQVRFIGILNDGKEILRVDRISGKVVLRPDEELQSKSSREYFKEAIKLKKGDVYFSDINLNRENHKVEIPHVPTLRAATPIYTNDGKLFGVIIINVNADSLTSPLSANLVNGFKVYLTNSHGDYLLSPNKKEDFGFDLGTRYLWQDQFKHIADLVNDPDHLQSYESTVDSKIIKFFVYSEVLHFDKRQSNRVLNLHTVVPDSFITEIVIKRLEILISAILGAVLLMFIAFWFYWRQRKKTQIAQARFEAIVESSNDAIIGLSTTGLVSSWNKSAEHMFGFDSNNALGKYEKELCNSQISDIDESAFYLKVSRGETVPNIQTIYQQKNGTFFDASVTIAPIHNVKGVVIGIAKTIRDVTEQNLIEQRILRLNESLERQVIERTDKIEIFSQLQSAILANAGLAIFATDPNGLITLFNPAA